jgi:hypothetical protein
MAKRNQAPAANQGGDDAFDESGFVSVSSDRAAPFWKVRDGARVVGELIGGYDMPDTYNPGGRRDFIQMRLLAPTEVAVKDSEETETLAKGETVSVGITAALQDILNKEVPLVDAGAKIQLLITCTGKRQKSKTSGFSFWPIEYKRKLVKPPTMPVVARVARPEPSASAKNGAAGKGAGFEDEAGF